jgi:hypothetical protein
LPSARQKVLGKEAVADVQFAERSLPSVTFGKTFAECKIAFVVCLRHTAKELIPVVSRWKQQKPGVLEGEIAYHVTLTTKRGNNYSDAEDANRSRYIKEITLHACM